MIIIKWIKLGDRRWLIVNSICMKCLMLPLTHAIYTNYNISISRGRKTNKNAISINKWLNHDWDIESGDDLFIIRIKMLCIIWKLHWSCTIFDPWNLYGPNQKVEKKSSKCHTQKQLLVIEYLAAITWPTFPAFWLIFEIEMNAIVIEPCMMCTVNVELLLWILNTHSSWHRFIIRNKNVWITNEYNNHNGDGTNSSTDIQYWALTLICILSA